MKLFTFLLAAFLAACSCQDEDCAGVDEGLDPVLGPCRLSVTDCVVAEDLPLLSDTFCRDAAETAFNNFLRCTNRTFVDQIFGAICGNKNCTRDENPNTVFADCQQTENRCFERVTDNDGTAAFQACMCASANQSSTTPTCSDECRAELEQLVEDVGCCTNTALYAYYFSTCGDLGEDPSLQVLDNLYAACGVNLPDSCLHPFTAGMEGPTEGGQTVTSTLSILLLFIVISLFMQS